VSLADGDTATAREALQTIRLLPGQSRTGDALLWVAARAPGATAAIGLLRWCRGRLRSTAARGL
jgi:hypothetical protein